MPAPDGYVQTPFGAWVAPDGSGPYAIDLGGPDDFLQLPSGFWVKRDGSGPYSYDCESRTATLATEIFGSI